MIALCDIHCPRAGLFRKVRLRPSFPACLLAATIRCTRSSSVRRDRSTSTSGPRPIPASPRIASPTYRAQTPAPNWRLAGASGVTTSTRRTRHFPRPAGSPREFAMGKDLPSTLPAAFSSRSTGGINFMLTGAGFTNPSRRPLNRLKS